MITLYWDNTQRATVSLEVQESDSSYRSRGLMQRPQLVLKFSLPTYHEIPVGAYCTYQGERFVLMSPQDIKKQGTRNIEYTLTMGTYQDNMSLYKMRNSVDGRLKYSMCSTPTEFIAEIVANLNARDGANVWSVGDCIDTAPKTIEFNHTYIDAALSQVAEEFETEWEIVNHAIHLHTVKYNESAPLPLSYGKGNGFVPGVGRTTPAGEKPIKRLYVQGGERNIDRSTYGFSELMLPMDQTLKFDGEKFEGEQGFDSTKARTYKSDKSGYYIERYDESTDSSKEDSIDCSDRYPSRVGTVSSVVTVDAGQNWYDFTDDDIPNDLNYGDNNVTNSPSCLIEGETLTVIFQTGMLAGKEFDVKYHHNDKRFEIVPFEYDGITMPNNNWIPDKGDTYIVFGCMLPDAYICDNATKTGASWDMMKMAARYLYANEDQKFTFTGKLQALWSRANWETVSPKLVVGGYIRFSDTQFAPNGTDIRIIGIKDFLTDPYAPTIDISNGITGQSVTTTLVQVGCQDVTIGEAYEGSINFTKRRFRDVIDTMQMLQESLLDFSEGINPITVQTMQALIGDKSLQFVFTDGTGDTANVLPPSSIFVMNNATKRLSVVNPSTSTPQSPLVLKHSELDSVIHPYPPQYLTWTMSTFTSQTLSDQNQGYYLYAKCEKTGTNQGNQGVFVLSSTAIAMESVSGYYHFLVGLVGKEHNGERSFVTLFGFTELLPGRVTTDLVISQDAQSYFDLVSGHIQANSAYIRGTFRSPFHDATGEPSAYQIYDNLYFSESNGVIFLDWDTSQSGRKVTICGTGWIMTPPTGKHIYFAGNAISSTVQFVDEIVTLIGYGDEENFYGWIIADRKQYHVNGGLMFGRDMTALAFGRIRMKSNIVLTYSSFDGKTITATRTSAGKVTISIPKIWFGSAISVSSLDYCMVILSSECGGEYGVGVLSKTINGNSIDIECSVNNDGVYVDGDFCFIVYNAYQWRNFGL